MGPCTSVAFLPRAPKDCFTLSVSVSNRKNRFEISKIPQFPAIFQSWDTRTRTSNDGTRNRSVANYTISQWNFRAGSAGPNPRSQRLSTSNYFTRDFCPAQIGPTVAPDRHVQTSRTPLYETLPVKNPRQSGSRTFTVGNLSTSNAPSPRSTADKASPFSAC